MDKKQRSVGIYIIVSAIIWGVVMIACSLKLRGTDCYEQIYLYLILGVSTHLLFVWAPLGALVKKLKEENQSKQT